MTFATLHRAGIARRIPHAGSMCLLAGVHAWSDADVHCTADNHRDSSHPMRTASGLLALCAVEYAAQAMALHGALLAERGLSEGSAMTRPTPGFLASVRNVTCTVARLDDIDGALHIHAQQLSATSHQLLYAFQVKDDAGHCLVAGRAVVVINTPLPGTPLAPINP